jgi:hypothetical protein
MHEDPISCLCFIKYEHSYFLMGIVYGLEFMVNHSYAITNGIISHAIQGGIF